MKQVGPPDHDSLPIDERISMRTLADSLLDAVEQTVQAAGEFIQKFKELARKMNLPDSDQDLQILSHAESLLLTRLETARHLASYLIEEPRLAGKTAAADQIAEILREVRRAWLFLQLKIFRVDRILDQERRISKTGSPPAQRKRRQQLH